MKIKVKIISKNEFQKWIKSSNTFAKSLIQPQNALKQFNGLSSKQRNSIKQLCSYYDRIRNLKIPKEERNSESFFMSVLVDTHIIATEFNIDPLTVVMCINCPCKFDQTIFVTPVSKF